MVAYSFQAQFVEPIWSGRKRQTIRATGKRRHAKAGDALQLYTGMRTKHCRLFGRAVCHAALSIRIDFSTIYPGDVVTIEDGPRFWQGDLDPFARADGFEDWQELRHFWQTNHPNVLQFHGALITWRDLESVR